MKSDMTAGSLVRQLDIRSLKVSARAEVLTNDAHELGLGAIIVGVRRGIGDAPVAATARLFADDTRVALCVELLDGRFRTAGELASDAGVAASTASEHLARLVDAGALDVARQGRHRYFRLAGAEVASVLEALAVGLPASRLTVPSRPAVEPTLRRGRTCYDHLAGRLGIEFTQALVASAVITRDFSPGKLSLLDPLAVVLPLGSGRLFVRPCLDWTEREYHAAGSLPAAITRRMFELDWLRRVPQGRAVELTPGGYQGLTELLRVTRAFPSFGSAATSLSA
ncbi:MAG: winged helix-turn-helix domain-containing protein [Candidatus Dormiibacterota bacterium]